MRSGLTLRQAKPFLVTRIHQVMSIGLRLTNLGRMVPLVKTVSLLLSHKTQHLQYKKMRSGLTRRRVKHSLAM